MLRGKHDPDWPDLILRCKAEQDALRRRMILKPLDPLPRFVAGVDGAFSADKTTVFAAAVIYDREENKIIEVAHAKKPAEFPYIPGFLSFREGPAVLAALAALKHPFGVICFDGQGYAHPRRCGLATHMAITLNVPGIGVAKSRFIGTYKDPGGKAGAASPLIDKGEPIGAVLRTRDNVNPLFISVGHKVDLASAKKLVLACITKYRIPQPTRLADIEVAKFKKEAGAGQ
jgi:deoxyribonuclease V